MADNTVLSVGAGGDTLRDKDRSGVKTPIVGLDLNPFGTETLMAGAMPVSGTFWQTTQPVSGSVGITGALPAGTNLLGQAAASNETATIYNGSTALTPQFALIQLSATGTVVALTAGKRIRVLKWSLSFSGTVNVKWQSHTTPTDLTGLHYGIANATAGGAYCPVGHFQTNIGEALDLNLSAGIAVGGELTYILV